MQHVNVIDPVTVDRWKSNFDAEQDNLYLPFSQQSILLSREVYDQLCTDTSLYIRFYFGLDDDGLGKIIAVPAYQLSPVDAHETGYMDLLIPGRIFELYSGESITFEIAKGYVMNWEAYQAHELWTKGFLIPRPNLLHLFLEQEEPTVEISLGVKKEISPMVSQVGTEPGRVFLNDLTSCQLYCPPDSRL